MYGKAFGAKSCIDEGFSRIWGWRPSVGKLAPPLIPPKITGLQQTRMDCFGRKKGQNLCFCLGFWPSLDYLKHLLGARDGNRTRTPKGREIFFTLRFSPPTYGRSCAGLCLGRSFRFRPPPSSLYTFPFRGLARCCLATRAGGSPNLTGFTRTLSPSGAQFVKSLVSTNFTTRARAGRHST